MRKMTAAVAVLLVFCLGACAWMKDNPQTAKLVVQAATMRVIEGGDDYRARATRVMVIAGEASSLVGGQELTLPALHQAILERLAGENLNPSDQLLANALIDAVHAELQKRIGEGVLNPEQAIQVNEVLKWIVEACQIYIPHDVAA